MGSLGPDERQASLASDNGALNVAGYEVAGSADKLSPTLQEQFSKHLFARVGCLIVLPFCVYLSFFWIHFKILKFSGTGDSFMSAAFQETLHGNELLLHAQGVLQIDEPASLTLWTDQRAIRCVRRAALLRHCHGQAQGHWLLLAHAH